MKLPGRDQQRADELASRAGTVFGTVVRAAVMVWLLVVAGRESGAITLLLIWAIVQIEILTWQQKRLAAALADGGIYGASKNH